MRAASFFDVYETSDKVLRLSAEVIGQTRRIQFGVLYLVSEGRVLLRMAVQCVPMAFTYITQILICRRKRMKENFAFGAASAYSFLADD
jgi:hypothetical protein